MTPIYEDPLWEWRQLGIPGTEFRFSESKSLTVPDVRSLFRTSYDYDPKHPEMYFFIVPETGVLVDWSRVDQYRDTAKINFSFWESMPNAYAAIGLSVSDRASGSSAASAGSKNTGNRSGQNIIGGRTYGYACNSLVTDDADALPLNCRAVAPAVFGGILYIEYSNPRGDDPIDRLTQIAGHVQKIEASFQAKAPLS